MPSSVQGRLSRQDTEISQLNPSRCLGPISESSLAVDGFKLSLTQEYRATDLWIYKPLSLACQVSHHSSSSSLNSKHFNHYINHYNTHYTTHYLNLPTTIQYAFHISSRPPRGRRFYRLRLRSKGLHERRLHRCLAAVQCLRQQ